VRIRVGAFRAEYEALLRADEFVSFRAQLLELHATLKGSATFDTMVSRHPLDLRSSHQRVKALLQGNRNEHGARQSATNETG